MSPRRTPQNARRPTRYPVLATFSDTTRSHFVGADNYVLQQHQDAAATSQVYVLQRSRVTTVAGFAESSSAELANQSSHLRDYCFVLLQLVHTLKGLQAEGIEEVSGDLRVLVLASAEDSKPPMLVLFPEDRAELCEEEGGRRTLCQATLEAMLRFLGIGSAEQLGSCVVNGERLAEPVSHTFRAIAKALAEEKASSLSQAKGLLEYMLWGPVDVGHSGDAAALDTVLQRWLDLQRAQMVKSTISHLQSKRDFLHVYEEYQLVFLLQASVKSLKNVISKL